MSAYALTMINPEDIKVTVYEDLDNSIKTIPSQDQLVVLGYFNAHVGTDFQTWELLAGVGKYNSNGLFLITTCAEHQLPIANTIYRLRNTTSWMHLIDYVITRRKDLCGTDC